MWPPKPRLSPTGGANINVSSKKNQHHTYTHNQAPLSRAQQLHRSSIIQQTSDLRTIHHTKANNTLNPLMYTGVSDL